MENIKIRKVMSNMHEANIGELDIYSSYDTVIAFRTPSGGLVIRQNDWSTTTGKHLNWINNDKSIRISGADFEKKLNELTKAININI